MSDKLRQDLIKQFNSEFPETPLEEMDKSELAEIRGWITTGNYALNWVISKSIFKGLPLGRIAMFSGDPATGKTMIAMSMMREPSIDLIIYMDSEGGGVTKEFAKFLGIDPKKILYSTVDTIEDLISKMRLTIDIIEKNKTNKNILMIVDSISMISTAKEMDPNAGADMGARAKVTRSFFRQYVRKMQKLNICAVFTAHLTETIGGYGPSKVISGGTILGYAPSVEVRFAVVNAESEIEQSARGAKLIKIRAEVQKSRLGTTKKRVKFSLDMENGLDAYAGLSDILIDYLFLVSAKADVADQIANKEVPKKSTGWYMFTPWDNQTNSIYSKLVEAGALSEDSRKFRESKIKEWAIEFPWFLQEIDNLLQSVYERNIPLVGGSLMSGEAIVGLQMTDELNIDIKENKKKKAPRVEITEA